MADFCKQCSLNLFGKDYGDLSDISTSNDTKNDLYATVICEGCGVIQVDHKGECVSPDCLIDHATGKSRQIAKK